MIRLGTLKIRALVSLVGVVLLTSCGSQINTLRRAASAVSGASGVPPDITSITITETSPTKVFPISLTYGIQVGTFTHYCILENSTTIGGCIWRTGALPSVYNDSSGDGPLVLTLFLKNSNGASVGVDSNSVVIDRTPSTLGSATITNPDPTNTTTYSLSYGPITNGISTDYCINENSMAVGSCAWQIGPLPASYTVTAVNGPKILTTWLRDAAGNVSLPVSAGPVTLNLVVPTLTISSPASGSYINIGNVASFTVNGTCSENGRNVVITGAATATVVCAAGSWTANLDFTAAGAGTATINVNHSNLAGTPAVQVTRNFTKDVTAPTVAISTPAIGANVNAANVASFTVTGTCSENTRNVVISGDASATVVCTAGAWTTNLDFTGAPQGTVTILVNHSDAAGNSAVQASRSFTKDTVIPTVAISTPAANSYILAANVASYTVTGTCSENTRNVVITGDASATVVCTANAWTANLDFTAAPAGSVTINVNHTDAGGNAAVQASRNFIKDAVIPTVAITAPAANSYINASNVTAYTVSGTCSENTRNVVISGRR